MKKFLIPALLLVLAGGGLVVFNGCNKQAPAPTPKSKPVVKTSFDEVTSQLDPGGSLYFYMDTEQWLAGVSDKISGFRQLALSVPDLQNKSNEISHAFEAIAQLVKDSGVETVSGVGMSAIQRGDGLFHNKTFVHHYPGRGGGLIWTLAGKPHELAGLDLLPANTALAVFSDLDLSQLWSVVQKDGGQSGIPQIETFFKALPDNFEKSTGLKWGDALHSLAGEYGFVLTLDDSKMISVPLPARGDAQPLQIPEPGLMLVVKVADDAIFNRIDAALKEMRNPIAPVVSTDKPELKMRTVTVALPLPIQLRPSVASGGGYLFIASSDALIQEALAVKGGKPGLKSTEEFKKISGDIPAQGNQFCFLSRRFGKTIMEIQQQAMTMNSQTPPALRQAMQSWLSTNRAATCYSVSANTDQGWLTVGNGSQNPAKVLAVMPAAAVSGMIAAIAIPNFVKARTVAQQNACINNLRMIDAAKQQWALEKNKTSADVPTWDDLKPYFIASYLHGQSAPQCPASGHYTIGAVGEPPTCSIPNHRLTR